MATGAVSAIGQIGGLLGSIIGADHQKAVIAEANNLNLAVPNYRKNLLAIANAFSTGQIDAATASSAVDEAINEYYSAVSGIISSGRGPNNCSNLSSGCNGPCIVGCDWVVPWGSKVKQAIQQGNATVTFDAIPSHAGFLGLPAWSLTVSHSAVSLLTGTGPANAPVSVLPPASVTAPVAVASGSVLDHLTGAASSGGATISPTLPTQTSALTPSILGSGTVLPHNTNGLLLFVVILVAVFSLFAALGKK